MRSASRIRNRRGSLSAVLALFSFLSLQSPAVSRAATYYVDGNSPAASDTNPGTATLPWKTLGKATPLLQPGDTVFVKEGVYRETVVLSKSGTATDPITITAYPRQEGRVIIDAAEPVSNWSPCTGPGECAGNPYWSHLYSADVSGLLSTHPNKTFAIRQVFQHGQRLPRSRFPDTGWRYPTAVVTSKTTFLDSTLSVPRSYLNGAVCHIKTAPWRIEPIPIFSVAGQTVTLAANTEYNLSTQFGYYVTSVVGEINEEGEWAYDPTRKRLYLWPRGDLPEAVEVTYREYCLRTNGGVGGYDIRGLTMANAYRDGVWLYQAHDLTLADSTVEYAYNYGIHLQSTGGTCDNNQILNNTIRYCVSRGINVGEQANHCHIEGNTLYAMGVEHFGGDLLNGAGEGLYIVAPDTRVYHNRIDRVASVHLTLQGGASGREISYNYLTNAALAVADTGSIYMGGFGDGPNKDSIHHNIIENCFGCQTMDRNHDTGKPVTPENYAGDASGIYVDEEANHRVLEDNTVINASRAGIFFHWAPSNLVQNNTLYGNGTAQLYLDGKSGPQTALVNDTFLDNILFATEPPQSTFCLTMNYDNVHFGQSDRNCFYHPYNGTHIFVSRYPASGGILQQNLPLRGWCALSGYDRNSREFQFLSEFGDFTVRQPVTSRIVYNATLDETALELGTDTYCDVEGNKVHGTVTLAPFESKILIAADYDPPVPSHP